MLPAECDPYRWSTCAVNIVIRCGAEACPSTLSRSSSYHRTLTVVWTRLEEARKVLRFSAEAGIEGRIGHVMIPGMIAEDDDRPVEMKPKLDVLEFWSVIKPELSEMRGLCTQVTAFMDEPSLRRRLSDLVGAGMEGVVFVGVPRTMNDGEGSGVAPTDALVHLRRAGGSPRRDPHSHPRRRVGPVRVQVQPGCDVRHDPAAVLRPIVGFLMSSPRTPTIDPRSCCRSALSRRSRPAWSDRLAHSGPGQRSRR